MALIPFAIFLAIGGLGSAEPEMNKRGGVLIGDGVGLAKTIR
jgi:hypothetical protein